MSPKLFSIAEKEKLRETMFLSGLELLRTYGMTHMSVEKIAAAAGIGKSTFYNFFLSKEDFVLQLIEFNRMRFWQSVQEKKANARPEIADNVTNFADYDVVFIGTPNWWADMPMPVSG